VKRAARHPIRALLLELHVVLHNSDDVCLSFEIVDECLGVTHLFEDSDSSAFNECRSFPEPLEIRAPHKSLDDFHYSHCALPRWPKHYNAGMSFRRIPLKVEEVCVQRK
jgi:hypothetical protein